MCVCQTRLSAVLVATGCHKTQPCTVVQRTTSDLSTHCLLASRKGLTNDVWISIGKNEVLFFL